MDDPNATPRPPKDISGPLGGRSQDEKSNASPNEKDPNSVSSQTDSDAQVSEDSLQELARELAKRIPDIRQNRIDAIRAALESRGYDISSDRIAERIIQETIAEESSNQD